MVTFAFAALLRLPAATADVPPGKAMVFNVKSYGAVGSGKSLETAALQRAIDACHTNAGGTVLVPPGLYATGTLRLRSHVTLHLERGAVLQGSLDLADYASDVQGAIEAPAFDRCLLYAENARDVALEGAGEVDGRGSRANFPERSQGRLAQRPMLLRFVNCEQVRLAGLAFRNSASWGLHFVQSRKLRFDGLVITSAHNNNNDGIDLDSCREVTIENCRITSGDDAICLKSTTEDRCTDVAVRNCELSSHTAGLKLGTSSRAGFANVSMTDTRFVDCPMGAIKLLLVDGGRMENIELTRLTMQNVGGPVFIRLGNRGRRYDRPTEQVYGAKVEPEGRPVGTLRGIVIRGLKAEVRGPALDRQGIMITGVPGHRIQDVLLEDIEIRFAGPPLATPVAAVVAEDVARYPEQFFFGTLPSWGLFARHVDGLVLRNVRIDRSGEDVRRPWVLEDVGGVRAEGFAVNGIATPVPEAGPP